MDEKRLADFNEIVKSKRWQDFSFYQKILLLAIYENADSNGNWEISLRSIERLLKNEVSTRKISISLSLFEEIGSIKKNSKGYRTTISLCTHIEEKQEYKPVEMRAEKQKKEEDKKEVVKEQKRFVKPSLEEVREYIEDRKSPINPISFWSFYESKGWKVGKSPMKNWKAAIATWETKRSQEKGRISSDKNVHPGLQPTDGPIEIF